MRDKKTPAMRVRVEGYTKKLQTRYNKGVQANCKAKGEKYGTKGSFILFLFQLTIFLYFFFLYQEKVTSILIKYNSKLTPIIDS